MNPKRTAPTEPWKLGSGPFIFAGVPPVLTGDVELISTSDESSKAKAIPTGDGRTRRGKAEPEFGDVRLFARLPARSTVRTTARLDVEPTTAPGTYETVLRWGEQREPAVLHVFASQLVELRPQPVELSGRSGESLSHVVVASNRGNVAHRVPTGLPLSLHEPGWAAHSVMNALRESPSGEGHEEIRDRVARELRASAPKALRVRVKSQVKELAPGEVTDMQIEVHLPTGLVKGMTYVGSTRFLGSKLNFRIECTGGASPESRRAR